MKVPLEKPGTPAELAHHGVKGMKWGVRKGYSQRQSKIAARERRVGSGKARNFGEKVRTHGMTSAGELATTGSFKRAALKRGNRREAHAQRIKNGEESVRDLLALYSNVRLSDIRRKK